MDQANPAKSSPQVEGKVSGSIFRIFCGKIEIILITTSAQNAFYLFAATFIFGFGCKEKTNIFLQRG